MLTILSKIKSEIHLVIQVIILYNDLGFYFW